MLPLSRHGLGRPHSPAPVLIESIATGVPDCMRKQCDTAHLVATQYNSNPEQQERIRRLYAKTCIDKRHMAVDPLSPTFDRHMSIRQRMDLFLEHAVPLAVDVSLRALAGSGVKNPAEEVGLLVLVTSTGFVAPGVDIAIAKGLRLSASVSRAVVNFMGCAAAMNGLRVAADYVRCRLGSKALVCCVELSSVNAVFADNPNDVIISSLFGDGCAAMVVSGIGQEQAKHKLQPGQVIVHDQFSCLVDDTLDGINLRVNHNGITCELSPKLPSYIYAGLAPVITKVLSRHGMTKSDVHLWAIHPGGPKIIQESLRALDLDSRVAAKSWDALSEFGNMLSVSLPFVLQRMVAVANLERTNQTGLAFSFAPGVTVEGFLFEVVNPTSASALRLVNRPRLGLKTIALSTLGCLGLRRPRF
ncbi:chalcone and stilbene synthase domain-containing protein [Ilyonectria robusta]|uniref:chalcone and stilbene synthase domain-containing protein n=1 Tax=Ilyonectria robusta TaxID=1079257 RepID=UPI001E8CB267|nr:chalcone and stilbene synthase domain-containing protein [Ilyonectria robusta]KAH8661163.1 chalcone and stilbene synthase domain-containing protein [Ilyonectria robusta]